MRVLFISGSMPPMKCGVGDYTFNLVNELSSRDNVYVGVLTSSGANSSLSNCRLQILPLIGKWGFHNLNLILKIVHEWAPDIVHIQYPTQGYGKNIMPSFLPLLLKIKHIRVVQTWHEPLSWKGWFRYLPNIFTNDTLVVVEGDYKSMLPGWYRWLIGHKRYKFIPVASAIPKAELSENERREIRSTYKALTSNLVVYFGFVSSRKGVAELFEIANPEHDRIILICELNREDPYHRIVLNRVRNKMWRDKVFVTGYLSIDDVGKILAAADSVIFPFTNGLRMGYTSFLAAKIQGVFILTTHKHKHGYIPTENVYYASPGNIVEMKQALRTYTGSKCNVVDKSEPFNWKSIIDAHIDLYSDIIKN